MRVEGAGDSAQLNDRWGQWPLVQDDGRLYFATSYRLDVGNQGVHFLIRHGFRGIAVHRTDSVANDVDQLFLCPFLLVQGGRHTSFAYNPVTTGAFELVVECGAVEFAGLRLPLRHQAVVALRPASPQQPKAGRAGCADHRRQD